MSPKQMQEVLQAISEAKTTHEQIRTELKQTLLRIQKGAIPSTRQKKKRRSGLS